MYFVISSKWDNVFIDLGLPVCPLAGKSLTLLKDITTDFDEFSAYIVNDSRGIWLGCWCSDPQSECNFIYIFRFCYYIALRSP